MSLAALKTDNSVEVETDRLGGAQRIEESNVYDLTIDYAYLATSPAGAMAMKVQFKSDKGATLRQDFWMTGRTANGGNNYYTRKDGSRHYLPGFTLANDLALLASATEISAMDTDEKMVKLYDYTAKEEVPTKVQMFTDLVGKEIKAGIQRSIEDKDTKQDDGTYVAQGETKEEMGVDKFFRARDGLTRTEIIAGETEGVFVGQWVEKNKGTLRNNAKKAKEMAASGAITGAPMAVVAAKASNGPAPVQSLFA